MLMDGRAGAFLRSVYACRPVLRVKGWIVGAAIRLRIVCQLRCKRRHSELVYSGFRIGSATPCSNEAVRGNEAAHQREPLKTLHFVQGDSGAGGGRRWRAAA